MNAVSRAADGTLNKKAILLGSEISRCNKMHLCAGWGVEWKWEGEPPLPNGIMRSRMLFLIEGQWLRGKSWDEDVRPRLVTNERKPLASNS